MSSKIVTLLVPTFSDRTHYLTRCLNLITTTLDLSPILVRVLDGAPKEVAQKNKALCESLGIEHWEYGEEVHVFTRVVRGLAAVDTPYVSFFADDDVLYAEGYQASLEFIQHNPGYVAVHGGYSKVEDEVNGQIITVPHYTHGISIEAEHPLERLFLLYATYAPIHYAIQRTEVLMKGYREMDISVDKEDRTLAELMPASISVCYGKVKKLEPPYCARVPTENNPYYVPPSKLFFTREFSSRYSHFRDAIIRHLHLDGVKHEKLVEAVDTAFSSFICRDLDMEKARNRMLHILHTLHI